MEQDPFRVVVVDDSVMIQRLVCAVLEGTEFEVVGRARDGAEALEVVAHLRPDLVTLDVVMPRRGGKSILSELQERSPETRVVVVSSLGTDDTVAECMEGGARMFVQKPFEPADLLSALRYALL